MRKLDIHFTSSSKFFPIGCWIIKAYMRTKYSHVAFKFTTNRNKSLIYEAVGVGVRFISESLWLKKVIIEETYSIDLTEEQFNKIMDFCIDHAGISYGYLQNIGIVIADLLKLDHNPFDMKEEVCSQILGEILIEIGYKFKKQSNLLTPKDIQEALKYGNC